MIGTRVGLGKVLLQMAENVSKIQEYAVYSSSVSRVGEDTLKKYLR